MIHSDNGAQVWPSSAAYFSSFGDLIYSPAASSVSSVPDFSAGGLIRFFPNTADRLFPNDVGRAFPVT